MEVAGHFEVALCFLKVSVCLFVDVLRLPVVVLHLSVAYLVNISFRKAQLSTGSSHDQIPGRGTNLPFDQKKNTGTVNLKNKKTF